MRNNIVPFTRPQRPPILVLDTAAPSESVFLQWASMVDCILDNYTAVDESELRWVLLLSAIVRYAGDLSHCREEAIAHIHHWQRHMISVFCRSAGDDGRLKGIAVEGFAIASQVFGLSTEPSDSTPF